MVKLFVSHLYSIISTYSLSNASSPNLTVFGMAIEVRLSQPTKASPPIDVTLSGMTTEVRLVQHRKAPSPIDVDGAVLYSQIYPCIVVVDDFIVELKPSERQPFRPPQILDDMNFPIHPVIFFIPVM